MIKSRYSTILFDFDGTLVPSLELWLRSYHYALTHYGQKHTDEIVIQKCFYRNFEDVVKDFELPNDGKFGDLIYESLHQCFGEAEVFSGITEILSSFANLNIKLAVVTSSPRSLVEKTLKRLGLNLFFDTLITADDVINFKPHPEPVLLALKNLNSTTENSLIIGDSMADILAGQAAKIHTGLFFPHNHHIFYDFKKLLEAKPHFVFHDYKDLAQKLTQQ